MRIKLILVLLGISHVHFREYFACAMINFVRPLSRNFVTKTFFELYMYKQRRKKSTFYFFCPLIGGGGQSLAEMFANKSRFFTLSLIAMVIKDSLSKGRRKKK